MDKYEQYRKVILKYLKYDINDMKQQLVGGKADKKDITDFDLKELLKGIRIEHEEHTHDIGQAIEIATDHLTEFKDYYKELPKMEDKLQNKDDKTSMDKKELAKEIYMVYKKYSIPVNNKILKETIDYVTDYLDGLDQKSNGFKDTNLTPEEQEIVDELLNSPEMRQSMKAFVEKKVEEIFQNRENNNSGNPISDGAVIERKKKIKENPNIITNNDGLNIGDRVKVNTKQLFARNSNVPSYVRLIQQVIRKSEDNCPYVCEVNDKEVGLGESKESGMFLGCVYVPKEYVQKVKSNFQPEKLSIVDSQE